MRTAIILSGHMRTFDRCLPTLHWHVFRHFPGASFFVSTVNDEDAGKAELLRERYRGQPVKIEAVDQPEIPVPVDPPAGWQPGLAMYGHEPYAVSVGPQAVLRQLWHLRRVWEMVPDPGSFDLFIRVRPDLWFHSFALPEAFERSRQFLAWWAFVPWWGRFGGVNDRFALLGRKAAQAYFCTFSAMPSLLAEGCPFHPESLVAASLGRLSIRVHSTLRAEFSTLRADGQMREPEITAIDIAHMANAR